MKNEPNSVKYFASWGSYSVPKKPQKEIQESELSDYPTYYKAHYDEEGRLARFEKYIDGDLEGYDAYEYYEGTEKVKTQTLLNADGEKRVNQFDEKGKRIEE
ncbi:DUF6156 family protein [Roseivirga sp. BDSF3-8]|uniref:DUF6156 family protein n=1 Tax=Roseivirga sp. BDSF3-8 TaxID=3241598 RepID=UPI003531FFD8